LNKIGITFTQVLQKEKTFPRSNIDAQIKEIGTIELKTCTKMLRISVKISEHNFKLETSPVEDQPLQQKDKKRRKRNGEKNQVKYRKA